MFIEEQKALNVCYISSVLCENTHCDEITTI